MMSCASFLFRKGPLPKKRKITYLEDSTDDEAVNKNLQNPNFETMSISSTSGPELEPPKRLIESFIQITNMPAAGYFDTHQQSKLASADYAQPENKISGEKFTCTLSVASQRGICPRYKVVDGTSFAVDAFRYGDIEGVSKYFLTHYHKDNYIGLNQTFNKPLYASKITAKLVRTFLGVDANITEMNIDTEYIIEDIKVIAIDANHCPGAVMFLFKFPSSNIGTLHTGHFRASADMESYPQFWNCNIDTVYLDTTYMNTKTNFQLEKQSIEEVKNQVQRFLQKNLINKFLIVVGTYSIGKEKVWMSIAETFKIKVWLEQSRRKAATAIYGQRSKALRWVVDNKADAGMHVIELNKINFQMLKEYHKEYRDRMLLGIRTSGCQNSKASKSTFNGPVSLIGVQCSEHSSYEELDRFMRFVQPKKIIPTVPTSQSQSGKMPTIPKHWFYSAENSNKPRKFNFQISMTHFTRPNNIDKRVVTKESVPLPNVIELQDDCEMNSGDDEIQSLADYMS